MPRPIVKSISGTVYARRTSKKVPYVTDCMTPAERVWTDSVHAMKSPLSSMERGLQNEVESG